MRHPGFFVSYLFQWLKALIFCTLPIALSSTSVTQELLCFPWFLQDFLWRQQLGSFDRRRLSYPEDVEKVIKLVQGASWAGYCLFSFYMWINIYNSSGRPFRKLTPLGLCEQLHFEAFLTFARSTKGGSSVNQDLRKRNWMNNVSLDLTTSLCNSAVMTYNRLLEPKNNKTLLKINWNKGY